MVVGHWKKSLAVFYERVAFFSIFIYADESEGAGSEVCLNNVGAK
jgi:hypothetical protein